MKPDEAPVGFVATLGHPANEILIVKAEEVWRYVHSGEPVDWENFKAGWDDFTTEETYTTAELAMRIDVITASYRPAGIRVEDWIAARLTQHPHIRITHRQD